MKVPLKAPRASADRARQDNARRIADAFASVQREVEAYCGSQGSGMAEFRAKLLETAKLAGRAMKRLEVN